MATQLFNRELSWIEFNKRVLSQAQDATLPLMERLQFLSIVTSNFDEFFQVRVASVKRLKASAPESIDSTGNTPASLLSKISEAVHKTVDVQYEVLTKELLPLLAENSLLYTKAKDFSPTQLEYIKDYFFSQLLPLLTPLRTEELFPNVKSLTIYVAFLLEPLQKANASTQNTSSSTEELQKIALVAIPPLLNHIIHLPENDKHKGKKCFTLIEEVVQAFGTQLFDGYNVKEALVFKVTRDADFAVDEDGGGDFIHEMEKVLIQRKSSFVVSLYTAGQSKTLQNFLTSSLELSADDVYPVSDIVDIPSLMELRSEDVAQSLSYPEWKHFAPASLPVGAPYWDTLKEHDVLLNVPYMSYDPVVNFINDAASDTSVLAIKMTLYRTGNASPIIAALEKAARNGKQVVVLVELKARFDEERNINWATKLENAGATVIYGLVNLKVHAKIALVIRREGDSIARYVHLSTGNYNTKTATLYSDLSIFTANFDIAQDATSFFNLITGYSSLQSMKVLYMAPVTLKSQILQMIEREIEKHKTCHNGTIKAKMNSLTDTAVISALYKASSAGVKIQLNIRGICMLIPGQSFSKNICVTSIVDRYLEHSRIFYFQNGTAPQIYLSSADWMERNLDRRIELMFPVLDKTLFKEVYSILNTYFDDNSNSHSLNPDGTWLKVPKGKKIFRAQEVLYKKYQKVCDTESSKKKSFVVRRVEV